MEIEEEGHKQLHVVIVIDGANVAFSHGGKSHAAGIDGGAVFSPKGIEAAVDYFRKRGFPCFAMIRHRASYLQHSLIQEMVADGRISLIASHDSDDLQLVDYARRYGGFVVTNDKLRDHIESWCTSDYGRPDSASFRSWCENHVIPFAFIGEEFIPSPVLVRQAFDTPRPPHLEEGEYPSNDAMARSAAERQARASPVSFQSTTIYSSSSEIHMEGDHHHAMLPPSFSFQPFSGPGRPAASPASTTVASAFSSYVDAATTASLSDCPPWLHEMIATNFPQYATSPSERQAVTVIAKAWQAVTKEAKEELDGRIAAASMAFLAGPLGADQLSTYDRAIIAICTAVLLSLGRDAAGKASLLALTGKPLHVQLVMNDVGDRVAVNTATTDTERLLLWTPSRLEKLRELASSGAKSLPAAS